MYWLTQTLFRYLAVVLLMMGVLAHGSSARAQTVTTTDALWAWDGENLSVCQNPTSSASLSSCFGGLKYNDLYNLITTDGTYVYTATSDDGWGYKCPVSGYGSGCIKILVGPFDVSNNASNIDRSVTGIAASGDYIWIAQRNAAIYRCPSNLEYSGSAPSSAPSGCVKLDDAGNRFPTSMVLANGVLYVGLTNYGAIGTGLIWRCDPWVTNGCLDLDNPGKTSVDSLAVGAGYLWAGLGSGIMWRCDLDLANRCATWNKAAKAIESISYDNQGSLAAGIFGSNGVLWSCPTATANSCSSLVTNKWVYSTAAYAGSIFGSTDDGKKCQIYFGSTPYSSSANSKYCSFGTSLLFVPKGGVVSSGSVNLSVPLQPSGSSPALTSGSTPALAANSAELAKLAKRCERGGRVKARVSLEGPYGSVKRNVNLCKFIRDGRPQVNFAAIDREHFYKVTASVERFYGEATFYLDENDELKDVSIELKRRGK